MSPDIRSRANSREYRENYDRVFRKHVSAPVFDFEEWVARHLSRTRGVVKTVDGDIKINASSDNAA